MLLSGRYLFDGPTLGILVLKQEANVWEAERLQGPQLIHESESQRFREGVVLNERKI
jgi:hypothetical protein